MTELDHKTFDINAVLAGIDYPEAEAVVYFDEKLGFTINRLKDSIDELDRRGDEENAANLQKELDSLIASVKEAEFRVTVKGLPEGTKRQVLRKVTEEFPTRKNMFGQMEDNPEQDEAYIRELWSRMIVKFTDPSGAESLVNDETIELLLTKAPRSAHIAINQTINEVEQGAGQGFEYAAKQVDFLSIASPEG